MRVFACEDGEGGRNVVGVCSTSLGRSLVIAALGCRCPSGNFVSKSHHEFYKKRSVFDSGV